ncbi:MAG TPA: type IV toxin-antitoxin system AbiEi family antitoxin domain-containing protein, partial [Pedococcus sp.]|nr:type IV toxin-antitoxin system AbiEi family antitoxin domain-containing protein [Pedococcus sp.]
MFSGIDDLPQPFLATEISRASVSHRALTGAVGRGEVLRLARGVYAASEAWSQLSPRARHVSLAR